MLKHKKIIKRLVPIFIGLLIAAGLKCWVFSNISVPTNSMKPTIMSGDLMIGSKLSYHSNEPARGDIITFYSPTDNKTVYVKRIIGLPGETVKITSGKVYINNSANPLSEPYINLDDKPTGNFGPYTVPSDCYFVMGDNRNCSYDSRYWETTNFVSKENILSKVVLKYFSSGKFSFSKF